YPKANDNEMEFELHGIDNEIYSKNKLFIESLGLKNAYITRDNYGFRLYHNLSTTYKAILNDDDFVYYDAKASVPNIIRELFIQNGLSDDPFLELFNGDFYENWGVATGVEDRDKKGIKKNFNVVLNGKENEVDPIQLGLIKRQFPYFYTKVVQTGYAREVIKTETDIILEDIFRNLPIEKALSIHDGFIVEKETESLVDIYLKSREMSYPSIRLVKKIIKTE
ncbi:MAG: hypothetical protein R2813_08690, partial [Flavobacteriales bacterium]